MLQSDNVIVVDIDGTICTIEQDYSMCKLMPGCLEALKLLRDKGYKIYLQTGRHINHLEITLKWLKDNSVLYDHIVFGKPPAKYYIDDRAISFVSWDILIKNIVL